LFGWGYLLLLVIFFRFFINRIWEWEVKKERSIFWTKSIIFFAIFMILLLMVAPVITAHIREKNDDAIARFEMQANEIDLHIHTGDSKSDVISFLKSHSIPYTQFPTDASISTNPPSYRVYYFGPDNPWPYDNPHYRGFDFKDGGVEAIYLKDCINSIRPICFVHGQVSNISASDYVDINSPLLKSIPKCDLTKNDLDICLLKQPY
ncbi:MAG: hypothetical protein RLZZ26_677, partial [Candidatus Parcubacteria bacterium]